MDAVGQAFGLILDTNVLLTILGSAVFGILVGAIPGLTATMATALLVPVTFFMPPVPALAAIVTATAMAIFAGDIPSTLLRMPGTPASAAYTDEAFAMTRKGQAELALGVNVVFSAVGGLFGTVVLMFAAPVLADLALGFSSFEYFWLACLGLTCGVFIASLTPLTAMVSLMLGLMVSTVGFDTISGFPRFTFGVTDLMSGVSFIPAMIGLFAVSEVLRGMADPESQASLPQQRIGNVFRGLGTVTRRYWPNALRGNAIGTIVGALPGAGADIAAWVAYAMSKKFSKEPEKFGTGHVEGIVDATSANNAALGAAWIPALVFGIPGDSITAIVIGVLYMKGMNPGPTVFIQNPQLIYAVFMAFIVANILMVPLGLAAIRGSTYILRVPRRVLLPIILLFCMVGSFAITSSVYGIVIMLAAGVVGWIMEENGIPVAPAILGLVLGEMLEQTFMTSMIKSEGNLAAFFDRPLSTALGVLTIAVWLFAGVSALMRLIRSRREVTA
ncbi:tripartite tricarboxylate transporter permease [Elioraea sp.]|uniref:tripartite tricarboxylate transporter permease n=1 Tax=Elioraea sp. TaxID=2185103 RepID=UPI0025BA091D|nr:tripartite tricarboxylate transporter permease [Elioraea sp.]